MQKFTCIVDGRCSTRRDEPSRDLFFSFGRRCSHGATCGWRASAPNSSSADRTQAFSTFFSATFVPTVCRPRVSARPATCSFWTFVGRASLLLVRFPPSQASRTTTCAPGGFSFAKHGYRTAREPVRRRFTCVCGREMASSARALVCFARRRSWTGP